MEIICFGDSITRGYDVRFGLGWVELCDASMEQVRFENHGVDGLSVQGLINNLEYWGSDKKYDDTRYICIMCGTNDILQGRHSQYVYEKLVKACTIAAEKGHVIIGLEPQIDGDMDGLNTVLVEVNEKLRHYGMTEEYSVIDFYSVLHDADDIGQIVFAGEVHPNERGYRLMAYKALEIFTRL